MHRTSRIAALSLLTALAACDAAGSVEDDATDATADADSSGDGDAPLPPTAAAATATPMAFTASTAELMNPERGYYVGVNLLDTTRPQRVRDKGHTLGIALVRLDAYKARPIDAAFLDTLSAGFAATRAAGVKVVLRFMYNAGYTGDAPLDVVLGHIAQLKPLLHDNQDVIAFVQAGFIGAWGEWHSSTNNLTTTANQKAILTALLAAVPPARSVQIRNPMAKDAIFPGGPLTAAEGWSGSDRARVGHHNDCFLATDSDYGTYAKPVADWKDYVAQDAQYTPTGGETCKVYAPRTDCAASLAEMSMLNFTYLNKEFKAEVLSAWEAQGCGSTIRKNLGYRVEAVAGSHTTAVRPGGELAFTVDLKNSGFAAPINARPVYVVLRRGTAVYKYRLRGRDGRRWEPGTTTVSAKMRVPVGAPVGTYELGLWLPDAASRVQNDPRYAIQLANAGTWDATTGINVLSKAVLIDASAAGPVDPGATAFVEIP